MGWGAFAGAIGSMMGGGGGSSAPGGLSMVPGVSEFMGIHGNEMNRRDRIHAGQEARAFGARMLQREQDFNNRQMNAHRRWQESMRRTQMQSRVADLKNAGLNPLLAMPSGASASGGGAATSSAKGASGGTPPGDYAIKGGSAQATIGQAIAVKKLKKELEILDAQKNNIQANTRKQAKEGNVLEKEETQSGMINRALQKLEKVYTNTIPGLATSAGQLMRSEKDIMEMNRHLNNRAKIKMKGKR